MKWRPCKVGGSGEDMAQEKEETRRETASEDEIQLN